MGTKNFHKTWGTPYLQETPSKEGGSEAPAQAHPLRGHDWPVPEIHPTLYNYQHSCATPRMVYPYGWTNQRRDDKRVSCKYNILDIKKHLPIRKLQVQMSKQKTQGEDCEAQHFHSMLQGGDITSSSDSLSYVIRHSKCYRHWVSLDSCEILAQCTLFLILLNNIRSNNKDNVYWSPHPFALAQSALNTWAFQETRIPSVLLCSPKTHGSILALPPHPCCHPPFISPHSCTNLLAEMSRQLGYTFTWYWKMIYSKASPTHVCVHREHMGHPICPPSLPKMLWKT